MKSANVWLESAREKFDFRDYQGAIADLNKAIDLKPDTAEIYKNSGIANLKLEEEKKAIMNFKRAIELGYCVPQEFFETRK